MPNANGVQIDPDLQSTVFLLGLLTNNQSAKDIVDQVYLKVGPILILTCVHLIKNEP